MDFQQMQTKARAVRALYAELETACYGRSWTSEEIMLHRQRDKNSSRE